MSTATPAAHVLIVDDSKDVADSLAVVFALRGLDVVKAYDAEQALALAAERRPGVVILDLVLPDMDGYSLAQALRQQPGYEQVLLVAYTGDGTEAARERCAAVGIDIYVLKPVDPGQLVEIVTHSPRERRTDAQPLRLVGVHS